MTVGFNHDRLSSCVMLGDVGELLVRESKAANDVAP